jgi:hypothetical protein
MDRNNALHPRAPINNEMARRRYFATHIDEMNAANRAIARDLINNHGATHEEAVNHIDREALLAMNSVYLQQTGNCESCGLTFDRDNGRKKMSARDKCEHILCQSCLRAWWVRSPNKCRTTGCGRELEETDWKDWRPIMVTNRPPVGEFLSNFKNLTAVPLPARLPDPSIPVPVPAARSETPLFVSPEPESPGDNQDEDEDE